MGWTLCKICWVGYRTVWHVTWHDENIIESCNELAAASCGWISRHVNYHVIDLGWVRSHVLAYVIDQAEPAAMMSASTSHDSTSSADMARDVIILLCVPAWLSAHHMTQQLCWRVSDLIVLLGKIVSVCNYVSDISSHDSTSAADVVSDVIFLLGKFIQRVQTRVCQHIAWLSKLCWRGKWVIVLIGKIVQCVQTHVCQRIAWLSNLLLVMWRVISAVSDSAILVYVFCTFSASMSSDSAAIQRFRPQCRITHLHFSLWQVKTFLDH